MSTPAGLAVHAAARPSARVVHPDRRFFVAMATAIALVVFVGFAPTFYLRPMFRPEPLSSVFAIHGTIFTAWIVLYVAQTALVSARRVDLHRKLGTLGGVLGVVMIVVGYIAAVTAARRGFSTPGLPPPLVFFVVPFFDLLTFPALLGAALYLRRSPAAHKRLMLLATVSILTAAIARLPYVLPYGPPLFFGLTDLFVVVAMVYDRVTYGRVNRALLWGAAFLVASQGLRVVVGGTEAWMAFAHWATGV